MSELAEKIAKEIAMECAEIKGGKEVLAIIAIIDKHLLDLQKDNKNLLKILWVVVTNINRKIERRVPLWGAVADFCGLGSTSAGKLCQRLGFNDDLIVGKENPLK